MKRVVHFFHRFKLNSLLMLGLCILLHSCKKSEKYCDVIDPIEELEWLKGKVNQDSSVSIMQMTYNSVEGIYIDNAVDFEEFNLFTITRERFEVLYFCLSFDTLLIDDKPKKAKDEFLWLLL